MPARCASCGKDVSYWIFSMSWCPDCRTLSCQDCRLIEEEHSSPCPLCKGGRKTGMKFAVFFLIAIILSAIVMAVCGMAAHDQLQALDRESLPVTDMANASSGDRVKLEGVIASGGAVALDGWMDHGTKNDIWRFDKNMITIRNSRQDHHFNVDTSGAKVLPGPHVSARDPDGTCYRDGDRVLVVGRVTGIGNSSGTIAAEALSPGNDFGPGQDIWYSAAAFAAYLAVLGAFAARFEYRKWASGRTVAAGSGVYPHSPLGAYFPERPQAVLENPLRTGSGRLALVCTVAFAGWSLLGISLLLGIIDIEPLTGPDWRVPVFTVWLLLEVIFFVLWIADYGFHLDTPSRFAYDSAGFGFRFGRSKTRGWRWAHVAKIKFDLRDKNGDVDRYTLTISPKKGLGRILYNVAGPIALKLKELSERELPRASPDPRLAGPDLAELDADDEEHSSPVKDGD